MDGQSKPPTPSANARSRTVEWYRRDITRRMLRVVAIAVPMMMVGSVLASSGLLFMNQRDPGRRYRSRVTFQETHTQDAWLPTEEGPEGPRPVLPSDTIPTVLERGLFVTGLLLIVGSNLVMLISMRRFTSSEDFLILSTDGMTRYDGDASWSIRWVDVETVRYHDDQDVIVVEMRDAKETVFLRESYAGIDNDALAKRIREVHRKAIWGLLPQQRRGQSVV